MNGHLAALRRAEADPRAGDRFRVMMIEAGGEHHDVSGVYRE